jgi:hypothetical protein
MCWCIWQESGFSYREDVFKFNSFITNFFDFLNLNALCKENAREETRREENKLHDYSAQKFIPNNSDGSDYASL